MDFITQLPPSKSGHNVITVFIDCLSKMAIFMPLNTSASATEVAQLFLQEVFHHHGLPEVIVSDCNVRFTSHFWKVLWTSLGTTLNMSTAFHPQTDGQTE